MLSFGPKLAGVYDYVFLGGEPLQLTFFHREQELHDGSPHVQVGALHLNIASVIADATLPGVIELVRKDLDSFIIGGRFIGWRVRNWRLQQFRMDDRMNAIGNEES